VRHTGFLHFFAGNGDLERTVRLDSPIFHMAFEPVSNVLDGVRYAPEPEIVVIDLTPIVPRQLP